MAVIKVLPNPGRRVKLYRFCLPSASIGSGPPSQTTGGFQVDFHVTKHAMCRTPGNFQVGLNRT